MEELAIKGDVIFSLQNMKKGNAVTNTMKSGEIVVNDTVIPIILQNVARGKIKNMKSETPAVLTVMIFNSLRTTPHTRLGYISVQLGGNHCMIYVYIKKEHIKNLLGAFANKL